MANPILLADTPTSDLTQHHLGQNLTVSCLGCWSTGLDQKKYPCNTVKVQRCTPTKKHGKLGLETIALTGRTDLYLKQQSNKLIWQLVVFKSPDKYINSTKTVLTNTEICFMWKTSTICDLIVNVEMKFPEWEVQMQPRALLNT